MRKRIHSGAVLGVLFSSILCGGTNVCAQENSVPDSTEENNTSSSYVTKDIEVAGEMKDPFGNVMTEQSYYRTGGDVDVIDRDMLESGITINLAMHCGRCRGYRSKRRGIVEGSMAIHRRTTL